MAEQDARGALSLATHQGIEQGRLQGQALALLTLLETRGLTVSAAARERILACSKPDVLEEWVRRALFVAQTEALFEER